ncbi:hypothetical protein IFM89_002882 [Coptis chinensis]|uniref:Serpin domain-containing protein n=1 Tax=Coptis chinensis TaxID=261450 RepID=A0A835IMC5_9MAGN|nr:hypothetical protein IFM89_002882 [Coptis chinensis]
MDIKDSQFYLLEGDSVEVPYVTSATAQLINTFKDLKVLGIPFRFKTLSMYILLPNNGDKLWSLIERVDSDPWFLKRCLCPNSNAFFDELKTEEANEVEAPDATATAVESTSVPEPHVDEADFVSLSNTKLLEKKSSLAAIAAGAATVFRESGPVVGLGGGIGLEGHMAFDGEEK